MIRIYSIGEMLIDLLDTGELNYKAQAGGAPANVSVCINRLGGYSNLITTLSTDSFGKHLLYTLKINKVNLEYVSFSNKPTMLAFVNLMKDGERSFAFYDNNTADKFLTLDKKVVPNKNDILHFCTLSLKSDSNENVHNHLVELFKRNDGIISFDPNLRLTLWDDSDKLRYLVDKYLKLSDIVKVSLDELLWISMKDNEEEAIEYFKKYNIKVLFVTKDKDGATIYNDDQSIHVDGYNVKTIDTTGAGDAFIASILYQIQLNDKSLSKITFNDWEDFTKFACEKAAISTTRNGSIDSYIF